MTNTLRYLAGISAALIVVACTASSGVMPTTTSCTVAALNGTFGSQRNGQTAPGTSISAVGLATFDGKGTLTEAQTIMTNGVMSTATGQVSTYTVADDCTGTLTDSSGNVIARLTVVHDGSEVLGMGALAGSNTTVHFEKITGICSLATIKGRYGFQRNGQTKTGTLVAIGTVTFDGLGNSTAQQISEKGGTFGTLTNQPGTYTVNPDCTSTIIDTSGAVFAQQVVVTGGDEILAISLTPGNNVVVHDERDQ